MTPEKSEEAMTCGELLQLISEQQRRLSVLEITFSNLSFSLDEKANQLLIHNLMLEAQNQNSDALMQKYFVQMSGRAGPARHVGDTTSPRHGRVNRRAAPAAAAHGGALTNPLRSFLLQKKSLIAKNLKKAGILKNHMRTRRCQNLIITQITTSQKKGYIWTEKTKSFIHNIHPLVGWDISTVDASYNAMMIRLHYVNSPDQVTADAKVDRTLWLTTDVAKRLISILEAGIAKIESTEHLDYRKH